MKKFYGILLCLALMAFKTNVQSQSPCESVSVEVIPMYPQTEPQYSYGVRVRLSQVYGQDVTVDGLIQREDGRYVDGWRLVITAGNLTAETATDIYSADPTIAVIAQITSVTPCPTN